MYRWLLVSVLSLLVALPAAGQRREAPPAPDDPPGHRPRKDHPKHRKGRKAPESEPKMPVREPQLVGHFEPESGPWGAAVTLHGEHFDETCGVRFNGRDLPVESRDEKTLRVRIQKGAQSDTFVVTKAGFRDQPADKVFYVEQTPQFGNFRPRTVHVGDELTILGRHFLPGDEFLLGTTPMTVRSLDPERVVVMVPDAPADRVFVRRRGSDVARSRGPVDVVPEGAQIHRFSPTAGSAGTVVRIEGKSFDPQDLPMLGNRPMAVVRRTPELVEARVDAQHATGPITLAGRMGRRVVGEGLFTVIRPPKVVRFSPGFGSPGTEITLFGVGFLEGDQVRLNGAQLTVRSLSDSRIVVELPAGVESGSMAVVREGRPFGAPGRFEVVLPPAIVEVTPLVGPPGTEVTLRGRDFLAGVSVLLAGQAMPLKGRPQRDLMVAVVPPGARNGRLVVVTRAGSTQTDAVFRVTQFAEIASFFPMHALPGEAVTIRGTAFHPGMSVHLGSLELAIKRLDPEEIVVQLPEGAASGKLVLLSYGRRIPSPADLTIDQPKPEISFSVAPQAGRQGQEVTLTLDPPQQDVMVFFDDRPLPKKTLRAGQQLIVTVPGDARTGYFEIEYNGRRYRADKPFRVR